MNLTEALGLEENSFLTCVGAGGKTSLLMTLGTEWQKEGRPFLLTATTKMFCWQVLDFYPVFCRDYERGSRQVRKFMSKHGCAAWFRAWRETKVDGLPPEWIDELIRTGFAANVLVEGDGARKKLLKVPAPHEPVIPSASNLVAGVLSLKAVGEEFSSRFVHRLEIAAELLGKKPGERIEAADLATLAAHPQGIFKGAGQKKVLVLAGRDGENGSQAEIIAEQLNSSPAHIAACVVTEGYGKLMKPVEVYSYE
ncbi:MAG: selenium cofactor biosynthesis protein YqeC [Peptococcaceae bacterium]|nr:selenium cofactor biosynthesis protein YqeC [Peptococcaceae bacterium]MDH7524597.1 selenium cofactor biosynthesis protein YqeC [Peptococcaceae bacterium]